MPVSTLSRPRPKWEVNWGWQLFFRSRMERNFPASSISIGFRWIIGFRGIWAPDSCFPASTYPRITCFQKTRFSLVPGRPMGFRGQRTSDSSSPHRVTSMSIESYHSLSPCRQCSFDLRKKPDKQTDRQTFFSLDPPYSRGNITIKSSISW